MAGPNDPIRPAGAKPPSTGERHADDPSPTIPPPLRGGDVGGGSVVSADEADPVAALEEARVAAGKIAREAAVGLAAITSGGARDPLFDAATIERVKSLDELIHGIKDALDTVRLSKKGGFDLSRIREGDELVGSVNWVQHPHGASRMRVFLDLEGNPRRVEIQYGLRAEIPDLDDGHLKKARQLAGHRGGIKVTVSRVDYEQIVADMPLRSPDESGASPREDFGEINPGDIEIDYSQNLNPPTGERGHGTNNVGASGPSRKPPQHKPEGVSHFPVAVPTMMRRWSMVPTILPASHIRLTGTGITSGVRLVGSETAGEETEGFATGSGKQPGKRGKKAGRPSPSPAVSGMLRQTGVRSPVGILGR